MWCTGVFGMSQYGMFALITPNDMLNFCWSLLVCAGLGWSLLVCAGSALSLLSNQFQDQDLVSNLVCLLMFQRVTMLTVGSLLRFGILQLPVQRICPAVFNRKSPLPGHTCSAPRSGGLSAVCYHMLPIRTLSDVLTRSGLRTPLNVWTLSGLRTPSGVRTLSGLRTLSGPWTSSGVRRLSGGGGDGAGEAGWYNNLSDSAPVHLCEHFLVSVQQVSGLPWWLSIVMSTLCVRTLITLPLAAYQMVIIAKVRYEKEERVSQTQNLNWSDDQLTD